MSEPTRGFHPGHNPWAVALTVTLATFMEVLDTSIANVALQHIAGDLSVGSDESTWVLTSYLVSNAIVLPISGWLATRLGRKRFYMSCVALFTVSSFLCGIAPNLGMLILFRVLQGAGGGGLGPSEQSILADTFPPARRGMAFAVYGMAVVLAPAIGPTLGGFITDHFSWRWVFFINVPVGIASLLLSYRMVQDPPYLARERKRLGPIDFPGLSLIALGLGCLEVVLDKGQEDDWFSSGFIRTFAVVCVVALVAFVVRELTCDNPVVDLRLFKQRTFAAACVMMLVLGGTLFGTTVLLPQFAQIQLGYTAQLAGEALHPRACSSWRSCRWWAACWRGWTRASSSRSASCRPRQACSTWRRTWTPTSRSGPPWSCGSTSRSAWRSSSCPSTRCRTWACLRRSTTRPRASSTSPATWVATSASPR
jgi:DHA2 family multidrug resistance protein